MANIIIPLIPPHKTYVEPYFGGGSIFFAKGPSFLEVINDINDNVINFYQVLKSDFPVLKREVEASLMSESLHKKASNIYRKPKGHSKIKRAWAFWYTTNFSFANKPGGGWKYDSGSDGSHSGRQCSNRRNGFQEYAGRLDTVQISCRDALDVIKYRDRLDTFFYLDPPYPGTDQGHYKGYTENDLEKLLKILESVHGKFILSNYGSEDINKYTVRNGWTVHEFDLRLSAPRKKGQRKREILVMNYKPSPKLF
jgi:DNA adenine methylase